MKRKYDLVIIGGTKQAFFSAEYAVKLGARVALIIDNDYFLSKYQKNISLSSIMKEQCSIEFKNELLLLDNQINYQDLIAEKKKILLNKYIPNLELLGVDIIFSKCKFSQEKKLTLLTDRETINSSSYLLAMTAEQLFYKEKKANKNNHILTINELLFTKNWESLPENLTIIGDDITAVYLVNKLQQLNKKITLICPSQQILPSEDEDISYQLQLFLESKGIKIYLNTNDTGFDRKVGLLDQATSDDDLKTQRVTTSDDDLKTLRVTTLTENVWRGDNIGLSNLGIKNHQGKIKVNSKLQTKHPKIYGCGDLLGGYALESLTEYEAKIAVNNALFFPHQEINYSNIPYSLKTNPPIYRLAYTEKQARFLLSEKTKVFKVFCLLKSPQNWQQEITFLKIILNKNNEILGFHSFGFGVEELITAITFIKKHNLNLNYLFNINFANLHTQQLMAEIDKSWKKENQRQHQIILDLAETFFIWKRS
ncbi:FAD-dependent oxidoreductase [Geminocystis herdmanii]|uniref:FAD-dependent oxidoreductase n=1 Tax=Geminocystis herdmanii TaxID=669359 RepID=UPI00034A88ED|nr:FAD-dependent oxidoreductase [Geminocystis herdmanii]